MGPPGSGARYLSPLGFDFGATRRPAVTLSTKRVTSYSQCLLLRLARHCCVRRIDFGAPNGHLTLMTHHRERGVVKATDGDANHTRRGDPSSDRNFSRIASATFTRNSEVSPI